MNYKNPRVTIGLPVYNGEKYLEEAIESILAQTYGDFELIISDNASTDRTAEICATYVNKDQRILYHRNKANLGLAWNQNHIIELSSGEYFMMAHHDDVRAPEYVERTIEVLDENLSLVLCYSKTMDIDEKGESLTRDEVDLKVNSKRVRDRFSELIRMDHICEPIFGLIRTSVLKHTSLFGKYADSDRVLLAELSLYGCFHKIPEYLFFRRAHPLQSTAVYPGRQERTVLFDPAKANKIVFPHFREFIEYLFVIKRGPVAWHERILCYAEMLKWPIVNRKRLASDIIIPSKEKVRPLWKAITSQS